MIFRKFLDIMFFQIMHKKIDMLNKKLTFLKDVWKKRNTTYSVYFIGKKFPIQVFNVIKKKNWKKLFKITEPNRRPFYFYILFFSFLFLSFTLATFSYLYLVFYRISVCRGKLSSESSETDYNKWSAYNNSSKIWKIKWNINI